jgi:hypothetical protein
VGYPKGVVSTSRLHRKSDSIVEAGRPATEGDWIEKDKGNTEGIVAKTSLRSIQDATLRIWHKGGVVLGFQVSIRGTKAGRAHLTIVNLFCQGSGWLEAVSSVAGGEFPGVGSARRGAQSASLGILSRQSSKLLAPFETSLSFKTESPCWGVSCESMFRELNQCTLYCVRNIWFLLAR